MAISRGVLTFDAEGHEGGRFHSRRLHVPTAGSGLTLGRGYDMKNRSAEKIRADLVSVGVSAEFASKLSKASGLSGIAAEKFVEDEDLKSFEITQAAQDQLFEISYADAASDVQRICSKPDCVAKYGSVDWEALDSAIKDILEDLRFRGDYTPQTRQLIQHHVARNDLAALAAVLSRPSSWPEVPADRFKRRVEFIQVALAGRSAEAGAGVLA
jgi:hypothetical protein